MSEGISHDNLQPAASGVPVPTDRRSGRKRTIVESYDESIKPPSQPRGKRIRNAPVDLSSNTATKKLPGTKPKADPAFSKTKVEVDPMLSKAKADPKLGKSKTVDNTVYDLGEQLAVAKGKAKEEASGKASGKGATKDEEKRLKGYRKSMPQSYSETMNRAVTQRMFIVNRERHNNDHCPHSTPDCPIEIVDLAGSTGNIYTVTMEHVPTCTCPNFVKGNPQCKHILYVLVKVLKAPSDILYQAAFLTSELREIFDNAGPLPSETVSAEDKDGKRKPVEGDCPICVEELDPKTEEIVWCHAACGNNLHKTCFDQWAASKRNSDVTCPYCRTKWETSVDGQALKNASKTRSAGNEGYVNIADQLGISGRRDYSTYHSFWVRREHRAGNIDSEDAADHYDNDLYDD